MFSGAKQGLGLFLVCLLTACTKSPAKHEAKISPPDGFTEALPKTDTGLPIVIQAAGTLTGSLTVALAYDAERDDALSRWGSCLRRVLACGETNLPKPAAACIDAIDRCPDDTGGNGCCAPACLSEFDQLLAQGNDELAAITGSFLKGNCQKGMTQRGQQ